MAGQRPTRGRGTTEREHSNESGAGAKINIDLGLGDLFKGLGNVMDLLGTLSQQAGTGTSETHREGEFQGPGETRGVYGFSVKMGLGGTPTVEQFGNIKSTPKGPEVSDVREPLVDIFDESDHILVVVELPGVTESTIAVEARDDILTLYAEGRERKYAKEILLPALIDPSSLKKTYQNGLCEVRLHKATKTVGSDTHGA